MKTMMTLIALVLTILPGMYALADWSVVTQTDDMTGVSTQIAISDSTKSVSPMGFPYQDTTAFVAVRCNLNNKGERFYWPFIIFSSSPNGAGDNIGSGESEIPIATRWDDGEVDRSGTWLMRWGANSMMPYNIAPSKFAHKLMQHDTLRIGIQWYGNGTPVFAIDLTGSSAAIGSVSCPKLR